MDGDRHTPQPQPRPRDVGSGRASDPDVPVRRDRRAPASPRPSTARSIVNAQNSADAVQPPQRCDCSKTSWARARTGGAAHAVRRRARGRRGGRQHERRGATAAGWCAGATVAAPANAHSHAVPAIAPPAWMPPTWCTLEMLQRIHSGHVRRAAPGQPVEEVEHGLLAHRAPRPATLTSVSVGERRQRAPSAIRQSPGTWTTSTTGLTGSTPAAAGGRASVAGA